MEALSHVDNTATIHECAIEISKQVRSYVMLRSSHQQLIGRHEDVGNERQTCEGEKENSHNKLRDRSTYLQQGAAISDIFRSFCSANCTELRECSPGEKEEGSLVAMMQSLAVMNGPLAAPPRYHAASAGFHAAVVERGLWVLQAGAKMLLGIVLMAK